ncbi:MAG: hypothetical protein IAF38_05380 [Bacteroidia bacterium]|nr:hypothetical protein [Bacteroidia bacterium]
MFGLFEGFYNYYYIVLIFQAICVFHSIRKGNQQKWIWIIVFLPLIGCLAYIFTEIVKRHHVSSIQSTAASIVNPGGRLSDLEKKFKFSDTFANRIALADAYLENRMYEKAIELYEAALKGIFSDNEHVIKQLIKAYHNTGRLEDIILIAPKVLNTIDFSKSQSNLFYAFALENTGKFDLAEKQYKAMNHRFSNYEARYNYGGFLLSQNRTEDATSIFYDVVAESEQLSRQEKGKSAIWINKCKEEWAKLSG